MEKQKALLGSAFAKINLDLRIGPLREDGYHETNSWMHRVGLCDFLSLNFADKEEKLYAHAAVKEQLDAAKVPWDGKAVALADEAERLRPIFSVVAAQGLLKAAYDWPEGFYAARLSLSINAHIQLRVSLISTVGALDLNEKNTMIKAFRYFFEDPKASSETSKNEHFHHSERREQIYDLCCLKCIPMQAGLGGGSADAAAVFHLLKQSDPSRATLSHEPMKQVGADVPFCYASYSAHCRGLGEKLTPYPRLTGLPLLIVKPPESASTERLFLALDQKRSSATKAERAQAWTQASLAHERFHLALRFWYDSWMKLNGSAFLHANQVQRRNGRHEASLTTEASCSKALDEASQTMKEAGINDFYREVFAKEAPLKFCYEALAHSGADYFNLTGSGSAFFAIYRSDSELFLAQAYLKAKLGPKAFVYKTTLL